MCIGNKRDTPCTTLPLQANCKLKKLNLSQTSMGPFSAIQTLQALAGRGRDDSSSVAAFEVLDISHNHLLPQVMSVADVACAID